MISTNIVKLEKMPRLQWCLRIREYEKGKMGEDKTEKIDESW